MHLVCLKCLAVNNVPEQRLSEQPKCGKCKSPVLTEGVVDVNAQQFQKLVARSELPVVVDFWAPWCGPCKVMGPVFSQVASANSSKAIFIKVNTEDQQQLAGQFGIRSIPTLKMFKQGKVCADVAGALPQAQLQSWVLQNL
jgi:thioredoxin 2